MMVEDDEAETIVNQRVDFPETGRLVEVSVTLVPSSSRPEGVKYRMQYTDENGDTILRYDNAHPEKGHDRHTADGVETIDFPGWEALLDRFRQEVFDHEHEHD